MAIFADKLAGIGTLVGILRSVGLQVDLREHKINFAFISIDGLPTLPSGRIGDLDDPYDLLAGTEEDTGRGFLLIRVRSWLSPEQCAELVRQALALVTGQGIPPTGPEPVLLSLPSPAGRARQPWSAGNPNNRYGRAAELLAVGSSSNVRVRERNKRRALGGLGKIVR